MPASDHALHLPGGSSHPSRHGSSDVVHRSSARRSAQLARGRGCGEEGLEHSSAVSRHGSLPTLPPRLEWSEPADIQSHSDLTQLQHEPSLVR